LSPRVEVSAAVRGQVPASLVRGLTHRLRRASAQMVRSRKQLTVRICDDAEIAALHLRHMGQAGPTDVLSFPGGTLPGFEADVLGDIILSWDAIVRQAVAAGPAAWLEEATQLAVHGLAHLHGHDHATRSQGRAMLRVERRAARAARLGRVARPYG
jgi:probable rRNA maturation factor